MKGIVFLFALILPGVVLSVSVETPDYWSILASAVQRYNQGTDDIRNRFYFPNDSDSRVKLDSYSPSLDQMIDKARHLLSQDFCDTVAAYNVSKKCCEDMKIILASLVLREMWAIQMVDSYGKLPSGILLGDFRFPGSYDQCKSTLVTVEANLTGEPQLYRPFSPRYCQLVIPMKGQVGTIPGIYVGMCVPDSCQQNDLNILIYIGLHMLPIKSLHNITAYTLCETEQEFDGKAIFAIVASSLYCALIVVGTLYDVIVLHFLSAKSDDVSNHKEEKNGGVIPVQDGGTGDQEVLVKIPPSSRTEPGTLSKLLQCFSVYHNGSKLLNTDQGVATLTCIHGIRFLSMTWVLLGHTYITGSSLFRNPATIIGYLKQFAFQAIGNATVSVDSFFLLSGLLVAYSTLKALDARQGKMNWIYFYVHRYWRLTPPILLVMMVYIPLFRYMGDGPFWPSQGVENNFCRDSWFYNILYINNFLPKDMTKQCMAWLWYLANDMQFYWISPLILIPLFRYPKIGHVIAGVLLLVNFICTGIIATNDHAALSMFTTNQQETFSDIYEKPYTRIGPYLVGLIVGYHLYRTKCHFKINKYINAMLWLVFTVSALCVLYGVYSSNNGATVSQATASFYTAVNRTVWGMCVGWVVFACCTGNAGYVNTLLSWKGFITLSRLTYCAYLTHPMVIYYFYFTLRYPIAPTQVTFVFLFLGCLGVTFMVATLTSLAFEAPMLGLEKLLLHKLHFTR
ncbi:nose resistant to fluoxetine protein 6-like [Argonauta hians]